MINNDVLRSLRYALDLSDAMVVDMCRLADPGFDLGRAELQSLLKREGEPGHVECSGRTLAHFLDGLVISRRGRRTDQPPQPVLETISNNLVLKKLRIAFELQDRDMHEVFDSAGFPVSKPELSALFRHPDHRNYRACGDQMLRNFLKGLTLRLRPQ